MDTIKEAHYNLGIAYLEAGQYSRAVPEFEAAIKLDANFIGAHCALCRAYLEQDELKQASTAVTAALKLEATHQPALLLCDTITQAYYNKGKEHFNAERYGEAVATFQQALNLGADLGDNLPASNIENKHIYAHLGAAYIGLKAYQEAIDALQNAIALDADLVDAHYNLGYAYVEQGSYDQAIPHLERAIAIAPNFKRAHYNLARAHRELGNLEAATHALTETLRLDPNYQRAHKLANSIKQAHYNRGITYLNDERYSEAITAFQNAITLDPDFTTAHYNLGLTYLKMEIHPRAVDALQQTIALDSTYKAAHHSLALAYLGQQELGKARDAAREALKLDSNYQPAISLLEAIDPTFTPPETLPATPSVDDAENAPNVPADTNVNSQPTHQPPDAIRQVDVSSRPSESSEQTTPDPDTSDVKRDLERGLVFLNNGQYNHAEAAFKKVLKADAESVEAYYGLGQAYLELGAFDDATAATDEVLKRKPNHHDARELLQVIRFARNMERNRKIGKKVLRYAAIVGVIALGIFVEMWFEIIPWPNPDINLSIEEFALGNSSREKEGLLDAGKTSHLRFRIKNNGETVRNIEVGLHPSRIEGVDFNNATIIKKLRKGAAETFHIRMEANKDVKGRKIPLRIQLFGKSGWFGKKAPLPTPTAELVLKIIPD